MKKLVSFTLAVICFANFANAQFVKEKTKTAQQKAKDRLNDRTDQAIDRGLDKVEEGISNLFKKKKNSTNSSTDRDNTDDQTTNTNSDNGDNGANASQGSSNANSNSNKSNSKFDFVPGTKELYFDNFERLNVGDFPAEYNTNASGEIMTIESKQGKWLGMTKNGAFVPDNIKQLPDNFTLEFDAGINNDPSNNYLGLGLNFSINQDDLMKERFFGSGTSVVYLHPGAAQLSVQVIPTNGSEINNDIPMPQWNVGTNKKFAHISVWRQKGRLRVYVNENKIADVPRFFTESSKYDFAFFRTFFDECELYLTNIRFAVAEADNRSKLITEGRFVTNGITFASNSDVIQAASFSILKEMGQTLSENPTVRINIIGHTDADGDVNANFTLSKKRAEAVKKYLTNNFGIASNRIQTEGKGESEPISDNSSSSGKAQNRRVEFVVIK